MHKLYEYVCDELKALEKKVESGQTLSMNEIEYVGKLTDIKKDILKIEDMEEDAEYSSMGHSYRMDDGIHSYARGRRGSVRRDAMGRYSRAEDDFMDGLRDLMRNAPDDSKRQKIQRLMNEM